MNVQRVPGIELLSAIFTVVHETVGEMLGLNMVYNIGARLVLECVANGTKMASILIFGNKVFKIIMALGSWKRKA